MFFNAQGVVERVAGNDVELFVCYGPLNHQTEGIAEIPLLMFPEDQRAKVARGVIVECIVDDTLLVREVHMLNQPE